MTEAQAERSNAAILSPRSARTLYNVADALFPPGPPDGRGGGDFDVARFVAQRLRWSGVAAARRCWALLAWIEWQPRLTLRSRRGFSWLPRERRRALLEGWARSRPGLRRRALARLRGELEQAVAEARGSEGSPQASPKGAQRAAGERRPQSSAT